jgi:hypothetical protein
MHFMVLGPPFPDNSQGYRGTSRAVPTPVDDLAMEHSANALILRYLDGGVFDGSMLTDAAAAEALAAEWVNSKLGPYEVVELTRGDKLPKYGQNLLGYDVSDLPGGESLVALTLLWQGDPHFGDPAKRSATIAWLREKHIPALNEHRLFPTPQDARAFLEDATARGPWESPSYEWEVVGLWVRAAQSTFARN